MPEKRTIKRVRKDKRQGKSASTQAGEFVRQEFHHVRAGKHGAKNKKQVIAIGLSEARRAGVKVPARRTVKASSTKKRSGRIASKRSRAATKSRR